jgi:transcription initiation factor TFIID TATA-box-binding protein
MTDFMLRMENVVAHVVIGKQIPLNKLVGKAKGAEYAPDQFPGLVYRIDKPKSAALIFSSGKIVCTGTKSIEDAEIAITKVVHKLKSLGISVPNSIDVRIDSILASTRIDAKLKLNEVAYSLDGAEYNPDQLNGMVYKVKDPEATFILFRSGKIICNGTSSVDDIFAALDKLKHKLEAIGISVNPVSE